MKLPVTITCPLHGDFEQTPDSHIFQKAGCPSCGKGFSRPACAWIETMANIDGVEIQHMQNGGEYKITGTRLKADGYAPSLNKVYEFYGNYWHGNPRSYATEFINSATKKSMGQLHTETLQREERLRGLGYQVESIWQDEWDVVQFIAKKAEERDEAVEAANALVAMSMDVNYV